jgi:ferrochelatase
MRMQVRQFGWHVPVHEIVGWHSHSAYIELRADAIRQAARGANLDLSDPRTRLVFSAHGTPMKYIARGSRYVLYTEHYCNVVAESVGAPNFELGYQNHSNRPIEWTQPAIETVIANVDADAVLIDPCSFMHEQSETLAELDHELREQAEGRGLQFVRVPIPHDDARFIRLLADLVEPILRGESEAAGFRPCICRKAPEACCLNTVI